MSVVSGLYLSRQYFICSVSNVVCIFLVVQGDAVGLCAWFVVVPVQNHMEGPMYVF